MSSDYPTAGTIAIRPPEFLPRCSVLALIDHVDEFVLADDFALSRQSHQNRTPIRTPDGRMWLSIPLEKGSRGTPIRSVVISHRTHWAGKMWRALQYNYSQTPFFVHFADELQGLLYRDWHSLGELTVESVSALMRWFGITTPTTCSSEEGGLTAGLAACDLHSRRYVALTDTADHDSDLVDVAEVVSFSHEPYKQNFERFERDLSALDLLFNWGPQALLMLRSRRRVQRVDQAAVKPARGDDVC